MSEIVRNTMLACEIRHQRTALRELTFSLPKENDL